MRNDRIAEKPSSRSANTYSAVRTPSTSPRVTRAYAGQETTSAASTALTRLAPSAAATTIARMTMGNAMTRSVSRITVSSSQRPKNPAASPRMPPTTTESPTSKQRQRHRHLGACQDPGEHVAAQLVGAEPMGAARRLQPGEVLGQGAVRPQDRTEDGDEDPERGHRRTRDAQRGAPSLRDPPPEPGAQTTRTHRVRGDRGAHRASAGRHASAALIRPSLAGRSRRRAGRRSG